MLLFIELFHQLNDDEQWLSNLLESHSQSHLPLFSLHGTCVRCARSIFRISAHILVFNRLNARIYHSIAACAHQYHTQNGAIFHTGGCCAVAVVAVAVVAVAALVFFVIFYMLQSVAYRLHTCTISKQACNPLWKCVIQMILRGTCVLFFTLVSRGVMPGHNHTHLGSAWFQTILIKYMIFMWFAPGFDGMQCNGMAWHGMGGVYSLNHDDVVVCLWHH